MSYMMTNRTGRYRKLCSQLRLLLLLASCLFAFAAAAQAATFTVTTTADNGNDSSPTPGSLRKAIIDANKNPGLDTIAFNIAGAGVHTISPPNRLPDIDGAVVIDGYTQPGASPNTLAQGDNAVLLIELNGSNVGTQFSGLYLDTGGITIKGLVINRFETGISSSAVVGGNVITGNFIGTDPSGTIPKGNYTGVFINYSESNRVGGTTPAARNVISGNAYENVEITGTASTDNLIEGNFIGTNSSGKSILGNTSYGICIHNVSATPSGNVIGGTTTGAGNVIAGNGYGIYLNGAVAGLAIQGNLIGTDVTGKAALPNVIGIFSQATIDKAVTIGGILSPARNIISGNKDSGIDIAPTSSGVIIQANYIGTDITGNVALGNGQDGIVSYAPNVVIGGAAAGARNIISGNAGAGVALKSYNGASALPTGNLIMGNSIGYGAGKNAVGNGGDGVLISSAASNNIIGGDGSGNSIGNNVGAGVHVTSGTGNLIGSNSIAYNKGPGIELDPSGVTLNDSGDGDTGPNNLQNYPTITSASTSGTVTVIQGSLNSTPLTKFHLEFFANSLPDFSGFGQGETFIGSSDVTTNANGDANFNLGFSVGLTDKYISATATDPAGNTSEFSACAKLDAAPPAMSISDLSISEGNTGTKNADLTVTIGHAYPVPVTVQYATSDGTATAPGDYAAKSGTLTFAPGQTTQTISISLAGDMQFEPDETFFVNLSNPANAIFNKSKGTVTILNDDSKPSGTLQFSAASYSVNENGGQATITVTRTGGSYGAVSVQYSSATGGTATVGSDYAPPSGTLNWADGDTSDKSFNITIIDDQTNEPDETVNLTLMNPTLAQLGSPVTAVLTIKDNDAAPTSTPTPSPSPTPVPSSVQFEQSHYSVNEADPSGVATIIVNRIGDASMTASVDYVTSDAGGLIPCQTSSSGQASERCDYATTAGTLRFAAGETQKIIQIPIIDDAYVEPAEDFQITLRNGQGLSLGTGSTATITIISDDTQTATKNPIDDQAFFIRQQYIDFLGRQPEQAGFDFWMSRMNNCPQGQVCDRIDTSQRFFQSDEFQARGFYVYRLYDAVLGRLPKYVEFVPEVARLNGPQTVTEQRLGKDAYLLDFMRKQEFQNIYGAYVSADGLTVLDAAGFINALCANAGITPANKQTLIDNLQSKTKDPAHALEDFILEPELSNVGTKFYDRAIITMQYFGYLRRDPEAAGFEFWAAQLIGESAPHKGDYRFMVEGFLKSDEYRFRFALISNGP